MAKRLDSLPGDRFRLLLEVQGPGERFVDMQTVEQAIPPVHERGDAIFPVSRKLDVEDVADALSVGSHDFLIQEVF